MERVRKSSFAGFMARVGGAVTGPMAQRATMLVGSAVTVAAVGYGAYKCSRSVNRVVQRAKKWWTNAPDPIVPSFGDRAGVFVPESARPGSEERPMSSPKCQALVGYMEDGLFCVVGNAVRIESWLVIPDHVKCAKSENLELRSFDQKFRLDVSEDMWTSAEVVDTDLLALELTEAQWSRLGLSKPRMLPSIPEARGVYASVVGAFNKGTTGTLSHHEVFGRVRYTGSTYQGYSGSAYMAGDCVAGIHTHGGSFNGGYSASYVLAILKFKRKERFAGGDKIQYEESDDWFRQQYEAGAAMEYDAKWQDLDEVRMRINGRYHVMARDTVSRVLGPKWTRKVRGGYKGGYDDLEFEMAGEARANLSGASGSSKSNAPLALVDLGNVTHGDIKKLIGARQARRAASVPPTKA